MLEASQSSHLIFSFFVLSNQVFGGDFKSAMLSRFRSTWQWGQILLLFPTARRKQGRQKTFGHFRQTRGFSQISRHIIQYTSRSIIRHRRNSTNFTEHNWICIFYRDYKAGFSAVLILISISVNFFVKTTLKTSIYPNTARWLVKTARQIWIWRVTSVPRSTYKVEIHHTSIK